MGPGVIERGAERFEFLGRVLNPPEPSAASENLMKRMHEGFGDFEVKGFWPDVD